MIDHIGISVSDFEQSRQFYATALAPLGYQLLMSFDDAAGYGVDGKPDFWLGKGEALAPPVHIAFAGATRAQVEKFYQAALDAGGRDNGPPGLREHYHPHYYAAFVLDPDGNNIEVVCHHP